MEAKNISINTTAKNILCLKSEKFHQKSKPNLQNVAEKPNILRIAVPKLNLQVLPNYKKKS